MPARFLSLETAIKCRQLVAAVSTGAEDIDEDTADLKYLVHALVNCKVWISDSAIVNCSYDL
jgi:hypothetical protein